MKKLLVSLLACVMLVSVLFSFVGCNRTPDPNTVEEIDPNRTQIYVAYVNAALGKRYMEELDKEFERLNPEYQVILNAVGQAELEDGALPTVMQTTENNIFFLDSNSYSTFVDEGLIENLTDLVNEKIYNDNGDLVEAGETPTQSIIDTMRSDWRDFHKLDDGSYYALPNYMSTPGIVYDADLFDEMGWAVPQTYPELIDLMDEMTASATPFCFSAKLDYIMLPSLYAAYAAYEGRDDFLLNSTWSGTDSTLGEITPQNAYLLQRQEGKKAAIKFAYDLASRDNYVSDKTRRMALNHTEAQEEYVMSINSSGKRIAMFLENSYWERECSPVFNTMEKMDENWGYGKRNFKYMPFPKFIGVDGIQDQTNTKTTILGATYQSMIMINKAENTNALGYKGSKEGAKDFLRFVQSRRGLALYTAYSGVLRAYNYTMTAEELALATPYARSLYELTQDADVEFVPYSPLLNDYAHKQGLDFAYTYQFMTNATAVGEIAGDMTRVSSRQPYQSFRSYAALDVDEYFEGCSTYFVDRWEAILAG